jgi:hypothetical protein
MTPGQAIRAAMLGASEVTDLVEKRIYPSRLPANVAFPAVVYTVISSIPEATFEGDAETELVDSRVQIDCYAKGYDDAQALGRVIAVFLTQLDDQDLRVQLLDSRDLFEDDTTLHRVSMDFGVWAGR